MADKATQLILAALGRAAADPGGLPLFAAKGEPALFPRTAPARLAAQRCRDEGYLRDVRTVANGKAPLEICAITDKGLNFLLSRVSPRQILEDCVRALEAREAQIDDLIAAASSAGQHAAGLKTVVQQALANLTQPAAEEPADWTADLLAELERWCQTAPDDCPLPELFTRLRRAHPALTIGGFHDGLRRLHDDAKVYLHPWTGPLYDLPEPAFALLIGHEIAYYASPRSQSHFHHRGTEDTEKKGREDQERVRAAVVQAT